MGDDLGLLIGRHGQTLDALQLLADAIAAAWRARSAARSSSTPPATATAAAARLEELALRSAEEASAHGTRVELEPMSAAERKLVHTCLEDRAGVATASEGAEPHRYVVVEPVLRRWLRAVVETPGLTALDLAEARARPARRLAARATRSAARYRRARSSMSDRATGRPGSRSRCALPEREVVLLDAARRRCEFLERWAPANARVVWGRAEEQARDWAGVALAKALAPAAGRGGVVPAARPPRRVR